MCISVCVRDGVEAHPHSMHQQNDWTLHIVSVTTKPLWHSGNSVLVCSCSLQSSSHTHLSSSQRTKLTTDLMDRAEKQLLLYKVLELKTVGGVGGRSHTPTDGLTRHVILHAGIIPTSSVVVSRPSEKRLTFDCCFYINSVINIWYFMYFICLLIWTIKTLQVNFLNSNSKSICFVC